MPVRRPIIGCRPLIASSRFWQKPTTPIIRASRCLFNSVTVTHTESAKGQFYRNITTKAYVPPSSITQKQFKPHVYQRELSAWQGLDHMGPGLRPGSILTMASWNLNWSSPDAAARTFAALTHLQRVFGTESDHLVVMLQEISPPALAIILEHPWVQHNFILSDIIPPSSSRTVTLSKSAVLQLSSEKPALYFTIMMVSKALPVLGCFRVPLVTTMGRDILTFDIRMSSNGKPSGQQECVRLCTTHLESLWQGKPCRLGQLSVVSDLLRNPTTQHHTVVAGMVGGDMNAIDNSEHEYCRERRVDLKDVWEDAQPASFQGDEPHCMKDGNTWGYQPHQRWGSKRMDKFLYSGRIETLSTRDTQDPTGRIRRFGIGLKTLVEVRELEREETEVVKGQVLTRRHREYVSEERFNTLNNLGFLKSYKVRSTKIDSWVSDHCGIAARVRIT
ncbi:hypothetical protein ACJZ2D_011510 [Fusarium nematophilum]